MASLARTLDCLDAAYRIDLDDDAYVRNLAAQTAPALDRGLGVLAYSYDASDPAKPVIRSFATSGHLDPTWLPRFYAAVEAAGHAGPPEPTGFQAWRHFVCTQASAVPGMRPLLAHFAHLGGSRDTFAVNALDASGHGVWVGAPLLSTRRVSAAQTTVFTRFAAHLTAALRVRRQAGPGKPSAAAILSPSGALLHAEGDDGVVAAREDLRLATLAFDQARTTKLRADPEAATRRWRPLVASRWSLLDEFDSDGRRFVVAVANTPPTHGPRRELSAREHQVLTQAHLGHTDKEIAYELGLSFSTVRVLLHRAMQKLGVSTRQDAIARFAPLIDEPPPTR
jgi:DNA-binding CsgD family transcriptional regulator